MKVLEDFENGTSCITLPNFNGEVLFIFLSVASSIRDVYQ